MQAATSKSIMMTASWIDSFFNKKPLWVEPPWQMKTRFLLSPLGIQESALFSCLQSCYRTCLSPSWTMPFPLGKDLFFDHPGLLQKVSATLATRALMSWDQGGRLFLYFFLGQSTCVCVSLCVCCCLCFFLDFYVSLCIPQTLSAPLCLSVKVVVLL